VRKWLQTENYLEMPHGDRKAAVIFKWRSNQKKEEFYYEIRWFSLEKAARTEFLFRPQGQTRYRSECARYYVVVKEKTP